MTPALPELEELLGLFYPSVEPFGHCTEVEASSLPPTARLLLAHDGHMTETQERFHGCAVTVEVLAVRAKSTHYARKILLRRESDGEVVQFGIVRLKLESVSPHVRSEIESQSKPLGRVLIEHNVLRRVELAALWRIEAGHDLANCLRVPAGEVVYGRTALIFTHDQPAVELLEVVAVEAKR